MDTKTLMDAASEAGINLRDEDGYNDATSVWITYILETPEEMMDIWLEALEELMVAPRDDKHSHIRNKRERMFGHIGKGCDSLDRLCQVVKRSA